MISVVIPVYNEADSIKPLCFELINVLKKINELFEIIFINDGSTDNSQAVIESCQKNNPQIISLKSRRNFGKATALQMGFSKAKGEVIVTMDGDLQDDPREMEKLIAKLGQGYDLVIGWKKNRQDSFFKKLSSKLFNWVVNLTFKLNLHDYNSGYKAFWAVTTRKIRFYGELHRFIPVFIANAGYKVTEVPVNHRPRKFGKSKYGPGRIFHGLFDLITVLFLTKYRYRPLHLFGYLGLTLFLFGIVGGSYLTWLKLAYHQAIGQRPLLLLSVLLIVIGVQIGLVGLLGELIVAIYIENDHEKLPKTHQ